MTNIFNKLKQLNKQRVANRREAKFSTFLSNDFDRTTLRIESLKTALAASSAGKGSGKAQGSFAVYSAYFGSSSNKTFHASPITEGCPHYFISNNYDVLRSAERVGWNAVFLSLPVTDNKVESAQQSKVAKALPHLFPALGGYRFLAYVDDKIAFGVEAFKQMTQTMERKGYSLLVRAHPSLSGNVLNEFAASMIQPRYQAQRDQTVEYIDKQLKNGLQLKTDNLYWTSAILRDMHHPDTVLINEAWYEDILNCGIECQISFDFVAQKFTSIGLMPQQID